MGERGGPNSLWLQRDMVEAPVEGAVVGHSDGEKDGEKGGIVTRINAWSMQEGKHEVGHRKVRILEMEAHGVSVK